MIKLFLKPEDLRGKIEKKTILLPLVILILSLVLLKSTDVLPIFTGLPPAENFIVLGPRDGGLRIHVPSYLPMFLPILSVPLMIFIDSVILFYLSKLVGGINLAYREFVRVFVWLLQIKSLEYLVLFITRGVFKLTSLSFTIYSGHINFFTLWFLFNLSTYLGEENKVRYKLMAVFILTYLAIEIAFILLK